MLGLLFAVLLQAGQPRMPVTSASGWTSHGPDGGKVLAVASSVAEPATVYAGTGAGLFKSEDAGAHWRRLSVSDSAVTWVGVAPSDPNVVYALDITGSLHYSVIELYRSEDAGETWLEIFYLQDDFFPRLEVSIDPADALTLYVGMSLNSAIYKSTAGGQNLDVDPGRGFARRRRPDVAFDLVRQPVQPDRLPLSPAEEPGRGPDLGADRAGHRDKKLGRRRSRESPVPLWARPRVSAQRRRRAQHLDSDDVSRPGVLAGFRGRHAAEAICPCSRRGGGLRLVRELGSGNDVDEGRRSSRGRRGLGRDPIGPTRSSSAPAAASVERSSPPMAGQPGPPGVPVSRQRPSTESPCFRRTAGSPMPWDPASRKRRTEAPPGRSIPSLRSPATAASPWTRPTRTSSTRRTRRPASGEARMEGPPGHRRLRRAAASSGRSPSIPRTPASSTQSTAGH